MEFSNLSARLDGKLGLPVDEVYSAGRTVWYPLARERTPLAVIRPHSTQDVAEAVLWARRESVRLSPRSGGHSFDGFPVQPGTVLIDFSQMNESHLRPDGILQVQPGARAQSVAERLAPMERALPTGDCGMVALGGLLSGAGFGYSSRKLGLTIDSVVGATAVTGEGEILEVSKDENPDLFWACRGGGGSAAIVTEFRIRSFPVSLLTAISLEFSWESAMDALQAFDQVLAAAPRDLDLKIKMRTTGPGRFIDHSIEGPPGCTPGLPIVQVSGQYFGKRAQAEEILAPLLKLRGLLDAQLPEEGYFDAMMDLNPLPTLNVPAPSTLSPMRVASDFFDGHLDRVSAQAIGDYMHDAQHSPELWGGCVLIEPCDGAVNEIDSAATAFAHRNSRLLLQWEVLHPFDLTSEVNQTVDQLLTKTRNALASHLPGGRYINYGDSLDRPIHWWGSNLARLTEIAGYYDPNRAILSRLHPV